MSNALFRSRQQKLRRNIKGLLILPPVMSSSSTTSHMMPNRSAVVLKAIYNFESESNVELSIKKGDFLRFITKPGNGWLKVQRMENSDCGLVPAAYVTIEVNDPFTPVSTDWLCEITPQSTPVETSFPIPKSQPFIESSKSSGNKSASKRNTQTTNTSNNSDFDFFQRERVDSVSSPISLNFQFSNITVLQVLQCDQRFYYRIDYLRDGYDRRYVTKTYQDFYNLHVTLLEISIEQSLPKLPQPVRQQTKSLLLIRCNELNVYINKLALNKFFKNCDEFVKWLDIDDSLHNEVGLLTDDEEINQKLLPGLTNILQQRGKYSTTAPLPNFDTTGGSRSGSFSGPDYRDMNNKYSGYLHQSKRGMVNLPLDQTLNSYSLLIEGYDEKSEKRSERSDPTTSNSDSEGDNSSVFLDHNEGPHTPIIDGETTPMFVTPPLEKLAIDQQNHSPLRGKRNVNGIPAPNPIATTKEYVKVKILLNNKEQDIILLKVDKDIDSVTTLKQQLSEKVYKDRKLIQHYSLEFDGNRNESIIIEKIRRTKKVNLKMVRVK